MLTVISLFIKSQWKCESQWFEAELAGCS